MVYQWKFGTGTGGVKAQSAGEYFERLEQCEGEIKPASVVEDAKPEDALLHPAFEWDDTAAAEKYRLEQARGIIGNIVVVQERAEESPIITRAVVNTRPVAEVGTVQKTDGGNVYTAARYQMIQTAMQSPLDAKTVIQNAKLELHHFMAKYRHITQFKRLFAEIESLGVH